MTRDYDMDNEDVEELEEGESLELPERDPVIIKTNESYDSQYKSLEELGKGKFGVVNKCRRKDNGEILAAKFVRKTASSKEEVTREIEMMNCLHHKRLIQLYDAFETPKEMVVIMELVTGGELFEKVVEVDNLTEKQVIRYMKQVLHGVQHMHRRKMVHLDLKPENILCLGGGTPGYEDIKLIDFGMTRILKDGEQETAMCGTPEFVAPEVITFNPITVQSDMWSIGVITYVLLSGLSPFMGDDDNETLKNVTLGDYDFEDDDEIFEHLSDEVKKFIEDLLVIDPKKRLTIDESLQHVWLTGSASEKLITTSRLKKFIARRRWQRTMNTIKAVSRLAGGLSLFGKKSGSHGLGKGGFLEKVKQQQAEEDKKEKELQEKDEALKLQKLEEEQKEKEEVDRKEKEKKFKEEAEKKEKERKAKEEAENKEKERKAKADTDKMEKERKVKEEAEKKEKERKVKAEAEKMEKERKAKEEAENKEKEIKAKAEAEMIEKERKAKEEADRKHKEQEEKKTKEAEEKERKRKESEERQRRMKEEREKKRLEEQHEKEEKKKKEAEEREIKRKESEERQKHLKEERERKRSEEKEEKERVKKLSAENMKAEHTENIDDPIAKKKLIDEERKRKRDEERKRRQDERRRSSDTQPNEIVLTLNQTEININNIDQNQNTITLISKNDENKRTVVLNDGNNNSPVNSPKPSNKLATTNSPKSSPKSSPHVGRRQEPKAGGVGNRIAAFQTGDLYWNNKKK